LLFFSFEKEIWQENWQELLVQETKRSVSFCSWMEGVEVLMGTFGKL
jgi:hypothetical protein